MEELLSKQFRNFNFSAIEKFYQLLFDFSEIIQYLLKVSFWLIKLLCTKIHQKDALAHGSKHVDQMNKLNISF